MAIMNRDTHAFTSAHSGGGMKEGGEEKNGGVTVRVGDKNPLTNNKQTWMLWCITLAMIDMSNACLPNQFTNKSRTDYSDYSIARKFIFEFINCFRNFSSKNARKSLVQASEI